MGFVLIVLSKERKMLSKISDAATTRKADLLLSGFCSVMKRFVLVLHWYLFHFDGKIVILLFIGENR